MRGARPWWRWPSAIVGVLALLLIGQRARSQDIGRGGGAADTATSVAASIDTPVKWTSSAKLFSIRTGGLDRAFVRADGDTTVRGDDATSGTTLVNSPWMNWQGSYWFAGTPLTYVARIGLIMDQVGPPTAARLAFAMNGTNVLYLSAAGDLTISTGNGQLIAKRVSGGSQTIAAASSTTINPTSGNHIRVTMGASITSCTMSAGVAGEHAYVEWVQDATGGRTLSATCTGVAFVGGAAPTLTATPNHIDVEQFIYDSSLVKWVEVSRAANVF